MRMSVWSVEDVVDRLPEAEPLESAIGEIFSGTRSIDLLIVANGFEDRSLGLVQWLTGLATPVPVERAIVLKHATNLEDNESRAEELFGALGALGASVEVVPPSVTESEFVASFGSAVGGEPQRVLLDISGASGFLVVRTLRALLDLARNGAKFELTLAYSEADTYSPAGMPEGDTPAFALDTDAADDVFEFASSGQQTDIVPEGAVVVCGLNPVRVRSALSAVDSGLSSAHPHPGVLFVLGVPSREEYRWRCEAMAQVHGLVDGSGARVVQVPSNDYRRLLRVLEANYSDRFARERMTVIPFGSKWHTVATTLFCEMRPDVRTFLVAPKSYGAASYSTGVGKMWALHLGDVATLSSALRRIDQVSVNLE